MMFDVRKTNWLEVAGQKLTAGKNWADCIVYVYVYVYVYDIYQL